MALIPKSFIQDLIQRIDIIDVIKRYADLKKKGRSYLACCPFHQEKTPSFNVSQQKQFYHCFGCGVNGDVISFVMAFERLSFNEAVEKLASEAGLTVPRQAGSKADPKRTEWSVLMREIATYYHNQLGKNPGACAYLKNRGLSDDIIQRFVLGFAPPGWDHLLKQFSSQTSSLDKMGMIVSRDNGGHYDRFRHRVMFPIHNPKGDCIAFGGRVLDNSEPKYLNSPETPLFQKSQTLYGLKQVLDCHREIPDITIVEGYMDVLALCQQEQTRTVATLGTATTLQHMEHLFRYTQHVIFCFDGDKAGRSAAWRALQQTLNTLRDGRQASFIFLPQGEDPDSFIRQRGQAAWANAVSGAQSSAHFLMGHLRSEVNTQTLSGRALFAQKAIPLIRPIPNPMLQDLLIAEVSKITRIASQTLREQLTQDPGAPPADWQRMLRHTTKNRHSPRLNPGQLACAYLIQHPELHEQIPHAKWSFEVGTPASLLLFELVEYLQDTPETTTAGIIEHYRGHEQSDTISQLACHPILCPIEGLVDEFNDLIAKLRSATLDTEITQLMQKATSEGLNDSEKTHLQGLMRDKKTRKIKRLDATE